MRRRLIIAAVVLFLLAGIVTILWSVLDWPRPRLILKYGFPPTGGPTGNVRVIEGIEFVELKPGYFRMGSHYLCEEGDLLGQISAVFGMSWGTPPKHDGSECPTRWVEVERPFWVAKTEVTNEQYERFDDRHERTPTSREDTCPVVEICRCEAQSYCAWFAETAQLPARLPSEAEWEFACRGGSTTEYCYGDDPAFLDRYCWHLEAMDPPLPGRVMVSVAIPVASLSPNHWGLFDMHGSVSEFCASSPERAAQASGDGVEGAAGRLPPTVVRGGSSQHGPMECRSAIAHVLSPHCAGEWMGFRPVFTLREDE